ncbi:MAG: hypothetical protein Q8K98_00850 [Bacteroidota bacterium]|nr:hypothetical protein [Bacteroidota bacterium]
MKDISLTPTNKPGVFQVMLSDGWTVKQIGTWNEANCTFITQRNEKKHLHLKSGSLAVNEMVLELPGLRWVCIMYEDASGGKRELKTSREYILKFGKRAAFASTSYEPQLFLELSQWSMERAVRFEKQLNSQQSLFEVA